jgi:hypothetical protein
VDSSHRNSCFGEGSRQCRASSLSTSELVSESCGSDDETRAISYPRDNPDKESKDSDGNKVFSIRPDFSNAAVMVVKDLDIRQRF